MARNTTLDERDLEILQLLWRHGPLKPGALHRHLSFEIKNPALRWLLNDLVERGQLRRAREGKAYLYSAAVERRPLLASLGRKLRDVLFGGSALAMIGELMETQKLSPKDIDYLMKIAAGRKNPGKNKNGTKS
jgi:predicted transcriptional regulator